MLYKPKRIVRRNLFGSMEKEEPGSGRYGEDEEEGLPLLSGSKGGFYHTLLRQVRGWWTWALVFDWALLFLILVIELPSSLTADPFQRYLPVMIDPSLTYPLYDDTVPVWAVGLLMLVPILIFALYQILLRSSHDFHNACLGLFCALVFTLAMTDAIKLTAGRYRPDWYARSGESDSVIKDGRQSFPSGHSSISFTGMVYLSLYIAGKTGIFRKNGGAVWKAVVGFLPVMAATAVAVSRVRDYHHHFSDILAGSILGTAMAFFTYMLNFNSLTGEESHLPKLRKGERIVYYDPPSTRSTSL